MCVLFDHNVLLLVAPKGLGWMLLPCDQRAHSVIKRVYYKYLSQLSPVQGTLSQLHKFRMWRKAFWSLRPKLIRHMFKATGICSIQPSREVALHLLSEGHRMSSKFLALHQRQLRSYLNWRLQHGGHLELLQEQAHTFEGGPFWDVIKDFL